jgi:hypothetical protein
MGSFENNEINIEDKIEENKWQNKKRRNKFG